MFTKINPFGGRMDIGVLLGPEGRKGKFKPRHDRWVARVATVICRDALSRLATQFDRDGQPMGTINL